MLGAYTVINVMPGHVAMTYDGRQDVKNISGSQSALRILPEVPTRGVASLCLMSMGLVRKLVFFFFSRKL